MSADPSPLAAKARRVGALIRKEGRQMLRDPSSFALGVVLPLMLILLFGYAMSLDVKHVPIAVVLDDPSSQGAEIAASFQLSSYFQTEVTRSMHQAQDEMLSGRIDAIVRVPADFARRAALAPSAVCRTPD